jgi:integrase/recombinase XerD
MQNRITIKPFFHRNEELLAVIFPYQKAINTAVRKIKGIKWTHKCWYLPLSKESFNSIYEQLKEFGKIEFEELKAYLQKRKKDQPAITLIKRPAILPSKIYLPGGLKINSRIRPVNKHVLHKMEEHLKLKAFSPSTIRTYLNEMAQLLQALGDIPADQLRSDHMKRYLVHCYEKLGLKENTLHSRINAMKFYYEQVLNREKFFWEIPRPKKQIILPKVLNEAEIGRLFRAIENLKHKAIVFVAYSAGLRVSEVVNLKIKDVDTQRMTLFIERAKGKKDRIVNLSPLVLDILRAYIQKSNPRPIKYLFEGEIPGQAYSIRSAQEVFAAARKKAGINKAVSFHALRHSFATHLLEKGVDIRYIKDILGHFDIKTTERYTHVSKRMLVNIISPLDDLFTKGKL